MTSPTKLTVADLTPSERVTLSDICRASYLDTISRNPLPSVKLSKGDYRYNILVDNVRPGCLVHLGWAATPDSRSRWSAFASRPAPQRPVPAAQEGTGTAASPAPEAGTPGEITLDDVTRRMIEFKGDPGKQLRAALQEADLWPPADHVDELAAIWILMDEEGGR